MKATKIVNEWKYDSDENYVDEKNIMVMKVMLMINIMLRII